MKQYKDRKIRLKGLLIVTLLILSILFTVIYTTKLGPEITGLVVQEEIITKSVNISVNDTSEINVGLDNNLRYIALSGYVTGDNYANIFLKNNETLYKIFDRSMIEEKGIKSITGFAVTNSVNEKELYRDIAALSTASKFVSTNRITGFAVEEVVTEENLTENLTNETLGNDSSQGVVDGVVGGVIENPPTDAQMNLTLDYNSGSDYDSNDDGIETWAGIVDFKIVPEFSWNVDTSKLCTKWEIHNLDDDSFYTRCYGNTLCCNFIGLSSEINQWNDVYFNYYGKDNSGLRNNVSAMLVYVDYNLSVPYSYVIYSNWTSLSARYYGQLVNRIDFNNIGIDLNISNNENYTILVELGYGTKLFIEDVNYKSAGIVLERNESVSYEKVKINSPVKAKTRVQLNKEGSVSVNIPSSATNITAYKVEKGIKEKELDVTAQAIRERVGVSSVETNKTLNIVENVSDVLIEYSLPGPTAVEENISQFDKRVVVSSDIHYENILAYSYLNTEANINAVHLYWLVNGTKQEVSFDAYDNNENGLVDYIEWNVPNLSNQTYEITITILNPYTYLRDGENWTVAFNTTGTADLYINSTNARWQEMLVDNTSTFDEMKFIEIKCGNETIENKLKIIDTEGKQHNYNSIKADDFVKSSKFYIKDYSCDETSYLKNNMLKAGYAVLEFDFGGQVAYAYDPSSTTISLPQSTNDLADVYYSEGGHGPDVYYGMQWKWNISAIPDSSTISDGTMCLFLLSSNAAEMRVWYINSQSWDEASDAATLAAQTPLNQTDVTLSSTTSNTYTCFNVTTQLKQSYANGNKNFTTRMESATFIIGTIGGVSDNSYVNYGDEFNVVRSKFNDREDHWGFPGDTLFYLNVTYEASGPPPDTTFPNISLVSPVNTTNSSAASQTFSCNITDETQVANLTLYLWNSTGTQNYTNTTSLTDTSNNTNWTYTLPYSDTWNWNCYGCDSSNNCNWSIQGNYSLNYTADTTPPYIKWNFPLNQTYTTSNITINITSDATNQTIWYNNGTANITYIDVTSWNFNNGSHTLFAYANDSAGNTNSTNVTFTVDVDLDGPIYSLNSTDNTIAGMSTKFSLYWADETGLSGYIFSTNNSGTWVNDSWTAFSSSFTFNGSNWEYRKSHTILNATGADINYTVRIIVVNGTGTDSGNIVYINATGNNKTRNDFGDIRFTNASTDLLNYWIESVNTGKNATFWVKIDGNLSASNQEIYIYYSSPNATNISNGTKTFEFFDDFDDGSIDTNKWNASSGSTVSMTESGGSGKLTGSSSGSWNVGYFKTLTTFPVGYAVRTMQYYSQASSNIDSYSGFLDPSVVLYITYAPTDRVDLQLYRYSWVGGGAAYDYFASTKNSTSSTLDVSNPRDSWKIFETRRDSSISQILYDDVNQSSITNTTFIPTVSLPAGFLIQVGAGASGYTYTDWFAVRKYVIVEPAHSTWGAEETSQSNSSWSNVTKVLNSTAGVNIGWCVYANDTLNNWNTTSCNHPFSISTIETTNPSWSNNKTNLTSSTALGNDVYFNITLNETNPDKYIFSFYNGTDWINNSPQSYTNGQEIQVIKTIPSSPINWTWYFNDTFGNSNQTNIWTTLLDSYIGITTIYPTVNINATQNRFFNVTVNVSCIGSVSCGEINVSLDPYPTIIFNDTFERASLGTNWNCTGSCGTITSCSEYGTYAGYHYADAGSVTSRIIDLSSYNQVNISYWVKRGISSCGIDDPDSSEEDLFVEYYNSTGSWVQLDYFQASTADPSFTKANKEFVLNSSALHNQFMIRFRQEGGSGLTNDNWLFDMVNITGSFGKNGLISTNISTVPFYTNISTNPYSITLNSTQSQLVTFWVNATGNANVNTNYEFYVYANRTSRMSNSNQTSKWNVTIIPPDTTKPLWSNNKTNFTTSTSSGENVYFNITLNDVNPNKYIFSLYNGTEWINDSPQNYNDGQEIEVVKTSTFNPTYWTWYFNDTFGNSNQTAVWSVIFESPIGISLLYPTADINITQNKFFNVTVNVSCPGDIPCRGVNVTLDSINSFVYDNFDTGNLQGDYWTTYTSNVNGRISVSNTTAYSGNYSVVADIPDGNGYNLNELITNYDFSGSRYIYLSFYWREADNQDEQNAGADHADHHNSDAVYFTCNGTFWYLLQSAPSSFTSWTNQTINITADSDFCQTVNSSFKIKFTQYDDTAWPNDGIAWDNINITYSRGGGGVILTNINSTPFRTNTTNPYNINLGSGESQLVTFWVNATGTPNETFKFYVYANRTDLMSNSNITQKWNITIKDPDLTLPKWSNNKTNLTTNTSLGTDVYFNITLNETNPDKYIFSFYNGTNWINDSPQNYTNGQEIEVIKTINSSPINWTWYINDTSGNLNQTTMWTVNIESSIGIDWIYPTVNINATQYEFFNITVNVTCTSQTPCRDINVSLDPQTTVLFDNMESGVGSWTHGFIQTLDEWEYGIPTYGPTSAYSGVNVWATKLATNSYCSTSNYWLKTPTFSLSGVINPVLTFAHWYYTESCCDGGVVQISTNNSTWTTLTPNGGYPGAGFFTADYAGSQQSWTNATFNLSSYQGNSSVNIRFNFGTDVSVCYAGWYIDDVKIAGDSATSTKGGLITTNVSATPFYTNTTNPYNISLEAGQSQLVTFWVNATGAGNSVYEFYAYANKTLTMSTSNQTNKLNITIQDLTIPRIELVSPTLQNGTYAQNWIPVNASAIDTHLSSVVVYLLNSSKAVINSSSSSTSPSFKNFTTLNDGIYYINASATDTGGNTNITETRRIILDFTPPIFNFTSPILPNNTKHPQTSFKINVTVTETNLQTLIHNFNGTNYTLYNDSLVLMYNFDNISSLGENSTKVVDVSRYVNNGTVSGAVMNLTGGKYRGAFVFDGIDDWVNVSGTSGIDFSSSFTVAVWAKSPNLDSADDMFVIDKRKTSDPWRTFDLQMIQNKAYFSIWTIPRTQTIISSSSNLVSNNWYYLVGMFNGTDILFYINGNYENSSQTASTDVQSSDDNIRIGTLNEDGWFNGTIDEVRIWNRSLSASEIYQQYASNLNKYDSNKWQLYINQSKNVTSLLDEGNYTSVIFASDLYSNQNNSGTRTITIDITAPIFINISNQTFEHYQGVSYNINTSDLNAISCFKVNDTTRFNINCTGYLRNNTKLSVGLYDLNITSNDTAGNENYSLMWVNITDTTPPAFRNVSNQTSEYGVALGYNFNASDSNNVSCFSVNDTANFKINCSGYLENNTFVAINLYWLNITSNDTFGNKNYSLMWVNVTDTTKPRINITYPVNNSYTSDTGLDVNYTVYDLNLASCWYSNDTMSVNTSLINCTNLTEITWTEGRHNITIWANDSYRNTNSSSITFVVDLNLPAFTNITNQTIFEDDAFGYDINATDANGISCFSVNDTIFKINCSGYLENNTVLNVTLYGLNITINDSAGNKNYELMWVNVTDKGRIGLDLITPTESINSSQNSFFSVTVNVSCRDADCGQINVSLDPVEVGTIYNFTTCLATGINGPTQANCITNYTGTTLANLVNVTSGIQNWTVPATGTYRIEAWGAGGASKNTALGASGAYIGGEFTFNAGTVIKILVGQKGVYDGTYAGGGGGATFVINQTNSSIFIIAGGGGGGAYTTSSANKNGKNATVNLTGSFGGTDSTANSNRPGENGTGGVTSSTGGGGGAGYRTNGANNGADGIGGNSYLNGGVGGDGTGSAVGGFGGGGNGYGGGGGGGGYNGGGGGGYTNYGGGGGGGGSVNNGTNTTGIVLSTLTDGKVSITFLASSVPTKGGLISTNTSATPFYTNSSSNPYSINLNNTQSQLVTFWVNSTGASNNTYEFYVYTNRTSDMIIYNSTQKWNVTITPYVSDITGPNFTGISNQTIEYGYNLGYDINATDTSSVDCFSVNDTANFKINCSGYLENNTALNVELYWVNITANDSLGNKNYEIMSVNVTSTTLPLFTSILNQTIYYGFALGYDINATDMSGINCFSVNDTANFKINCSGYLENNTALNVDLYWINITTNDTVGNKNYEIMSVNVSGLDITSPKVNITYPLNGSVFSYSTTSVPLNLTTNENATCFYSNNSGQTNYSMEANSTNRLFNATLNVSAGNIYTINVYCNDSSNNWNRTESTIFSLNISPLIKISMIYPSASINVSKNELFNITANITCLSEDCDNINVSLDPAVGYGTTSPYDSGTSANSCKEAGASGTINTCADGSNCAYPFTVQRIIVTDLNNSVFKTGDTVNVSVTTNTDCCSPDLGFAYSNTSNSSSIFKAKGRVVNIASGLKNYSITFVLDNVVGNHTIRAMNVYSSVSTSITCGYSESSGATYSDTDDVIINVVSSSAGKGGLISTNTSATPFYTNTTNPYNITLSENQSQLVTFWVNATGSLSTTYDFFVYANITSSGIAIKNESSHWNVTIKDLTNPMIMFNPSSTANGSHNLEKTITINISASDIYLDTIKVYLYNLSALINSSSSTYLQVANLSYGTYYINATANDTSGNINSTETRTIILTRSSLSITRDYPTADINVEQNRWFNVSINVTCLEQDCNNINVTLDPVTNIECGAITNCDFTQTGDCSNEDNTCTNIPGWTYYEITDGTYERAKVSNTSNPFGDSKGSWLEFRSTYTGVSSTNWKSYIYSDAFAADADYITYNFYGDEYDEWGYGLMIYEDNNETENYQILEYRCPFTGSWSATDDVWGGCNDNQDYHPGAKTGKTIAINSSLKNKNIRIKAWTGDGSSGDKGDASIDDICLSYSNGVCISSTKSTISTISGTLPFWTNHTSNPYTINLNSTNSTIVTFWVNATGTKGSTYEFFAYATVASDTSIRNDTTHWNVTITDATVPLINFVSPTTENGNYSQSYIDANITAIDDNLDNITVYFYNSSGLANTTSSESSQYYIRFSNLADGTYSINSTAFDTGNNSASTETRTIKIDTISPLINISAPVDKFNTTLSELNFSFSITDNSTSNCTVYKDVEGSVSYTAGNSNASVFPETSTTLNVSLAGNRTHSWYINCTDLAGNSNITATRTLTVDQIAPQIVVSSPAENGSFGYLIYIQTEITDSQSLVDSVWYYMYNNSNESQKLANGTLNISSSWDSSWNSSSYQNAEWNVTLSIFANDTLGNIINKNVSFYLDNNKPVIQLIVPSSILNYYSSNFSLDIKVQDLSLNYTYYNISIQGITIQYNSTSYESSISEHAWRDNVNVTESAEGTYNLNVFGGDSVGNNINVSTSFIIDKSSPSLTVHYPSENVYLNTTAINFNWTAIDNISTSFNCNLTVGGSTKQIYCLNSTSCNYTFAGFSEARYNTNISCKDNASNSVIKSFNFTIDKTSPLISFTESTISSGNHSQNYTAINVSVTDQNIDTLTLTFYNSSYSIINTSSTSSNSLFMNITNLQEGYYYFNATVNDSSGYRNSTETRNIFLDYISPAVSISKNASNLEYGSDSISINWSVNDDNLKMISLNITLPGGYLLYSSIEPSEGVNLTPVELVGTGTYNISLYSRDTAENINTASTTFGVDDTIPPTIYFVNPVIGNFSRSWIFINVTSPEASLVSLTIYLHNQTALYNQSAGTSSPHSINFTSLPDGIYYYNATACDETTCNSTATKAIMLDTTLPLISFETPTPTIESSTVNQLSANVSASDNNLDTIKIYLYNSSEVLIVSATNLSSPLFYNFTGLADGIYYLNATANDTSGNREQTGTRTITLDALAPYVRILSPTNTTYNTTNITINITSDSTNNTIWYNNGTDNIIYTNVTTALFSEDSHTIIAYANDSINNINSTSIIFTVLLCSPSFTNTSWSSWYNTTSCQANDTVQQAKNLTQYDSSECASNTTFFNYSYASCDFCTPNLTNTSWTYWNNETCSANQMNQSRNLTQYDANNCSEIGNTTFYEYQLVNDLVNTSWSDWINITACQSNNTVRQSRNLTQYDTYGCASNTTYYNYNDEICDATPPYIKINSPINTSYSTANITINFTSDATNHTIWYYNGSVNKTYIIPTTWNFTEGSHTIIAYANDSLDNINTTSVYFNIDTIAPYIKINSPTNTTYTTSNITINFTSDATNNTLWWENNSYNNITYISPTTALFADGSHIIIAYANDSSTNRNITLALIFTVDANPPTITINSPLNVTYNSTNITFNVTTNENGTCIYKLDSADYNLSMNTTDNRNFNYTNSSLTEDSHTVIFWCNDTLGNLNSTTRIFADFSQLIFNATLVNYNITGINSSMKYYYNNQELAHNSSENGTLTGLVINTLVDLEFKTYNNRLVVTLRNINVSSESNKVFGIDKFSTPLTGYLVNYGINATYNFTNSTVRIYYDDLTISNEANLKLEKCYNYSFTSQTCVGAWTDITSSSYQNLIEDYLETNVTSFSGFAIKESEEAEVVSISDSESSGGGDCVTTWICNEWSECKSGIQTRTCTKAVNICFAPEKPETTRLCEIIEKPEEFDETQIEKLSPEPSKFNLWIKTNITKLLFFVLIMAALFLYIYFIEERKEIYLGNIFKIVEAF